MEKQYEDVLVKLYDDAKKTNDHTTLATDIGIRDDDRPRICEWLEMQGYIENVSGNGKTNVQCHVTDKTFEYFKDKA